MFGNVDAFVLVMSHEIGPKSFSATDPRSPADGSVRVGSERSRSRPAMMASLNVNHTMAAERRLDIKHDVAGVLNAWVRSLEHGEALGLATDAR